ncbi:PREDICTED: membrane protein of ER body 2-like isoform X2 [Ipomoea nil]|uniref:membrane protein of ER body 2-like isoform X2 n=1 Tax=Ipomoea nil TaxID=35883 RepID=UPI000901AEFE|nr:PREDICTED: membrane protein of ER body 2-like isoform X2 [Ipomoea nil]
MEKEGHKREPEELVLEAEEEEEEVGMLVRGSKYNISKEVSNCHIEKNGYANLPSVTENGGQESTFDGDQEGAEEHVDPTPADRAGIKDCLPRLENCVYFDKDEGIWKCRVCRWNCQNESVCFGLPQMPKGQLHKLLDYKTLDQCGLYFSFESEDGKLTSSSSSVKESNKRNPGDVCIEGSLLTDLQYHGNLKDENLPNFNILPTGTLPQEPGTVHKLSTVEEIESADVDQITDSEIDAKDYDVENVLRKQNTHDLYCPNCHSCVTRRVILRKRKRNVRISSGEVKRNKLGTASESKFDTQLSSDECHDEPLISLDDTPISAVNGYDRDREPEIFRCLSCFSFFIPTGSGFKLFQIFGKKDDQENKRDEQGVRMSKNWFSSIFASDKGSADKGEDHRLDVGKNNNEVILPSSNLCDKSDQSSSIQETIPPVHVDSRSIDLRETGANISTSQNTELERAEKIMNDAKDISVSAIMGKNGDPVNHFEVDTNHQLNLSNGIEVNGAINEALTPANETQVGTESFVESTLSASQTGLKILITSNEESMTLEKKQADKICDSPGSEGETKLDISTDSPQQHIGAVLLSEPPVENMDTMFQTVTKGEDTIISVVEAGPTETAESMNLPNLATEMCAVEQQGSNAREGNKIEIIKSIVYGGLAESITSLSIVSSAAAAGTATLYIFALSAANLVGGFLIILNNLWELKKDCPEQASNQIMEPGDRYGKLLGHRENFVIHAIAIVLSYAVFGLVPPTVYGFSFRKSDDMELKLIAAAAASLLCTIVLATGKVYAQRPPKSYLKTITFYVVLGFVVSGVSFAAGQLINRLLLKLGLFQSSSEVNLFQPGVTPAHKAAWASY